MTSADLAPGDPEHLIRALFAAIDGGDLDALAALFSTGARQRVGNRDWTTGPDGVREGAAALRSAVAGLQHDVTGFWDVGDSVLVSSEVHYDRLDGQRVTVPAMTRYSVDDQGLIAEYQVWSDTSPVFTTAPL